MKLRDAIENRCDVKRYDGKVADWRKILRAIDFARFAPQVGGHFSVRFILVSDEKVIERIARSSKQDFISGAKQCVVVVSDDASMVRSYTDRGSDYAKKHVGAVIENFLLGLEEEKLVTSWVWYFNEDDVRSALEIPGRVKVEAIFPVAKKSKLAKLEKTPVKLDNIMFFEKYGVKKMNPNKKASWESL